MLSTVDAVFVGGDDEGGENGFLGCMRYLEINSERQDEIPDERNHGVINGSCYVQNRWVKRGWGGGGRDEI